MALEKGYGITFFKNLNQTKEFVYKNLSFGCFIYDEIFEIWEVLPGNIIIHNKSLLGRSSVSAIYSGYIKKSPRAWPKGTLMSNKLTLLKLIKKI